MFECYVVLGASPPPSHHTIIYLYVLRTANILQQYRIEKECYKIVLKRTVCKGINSFGRNDQSTSLLPVLVLFLPHRRASVVSEWVIIGFTLQRSSLSYSLLPRGE